MQIERNDKPNWNELQFLSWSEFNQMAPAILKLEVDRLAALVRSAAPGTDFHNGLVRARYAVQQFIDALGKARKENVGETCAGYLRTAIMNLSVRPDGLDAETQATCEYVLDRLNYIHQRIRLIY